MRIEHINEKITGNLPIDVQCQIYSDGRIIPLKVNIPEAGGYSQEYKVKKYRDIDKNRKEAVLPNGVEVHSKYRDRDFDLVIEFLGRVRMVRVRYHLGEGIWYLVR